MLSYGQLKEAITNCIRPLKNRVYTMITRAVIESVKDSDGMQVVKVNLLAGETRSDVERFQNFGFTSNPPKSSEAVALAMGGDRDHLIVIVADDRKTRVKNLEEGESAFYNKGGDNLTLKNSGNLEGELRENFEMTLKKLKFENDQGEVIDILVQALQALSVEPFIVNKGTFAILKTQLESFKVGGA